MPHTICCVATKPNIAFYEGITDKRLAGFGKNDLTI